MTDYNFFGDLKSFQKADYDVFAPLTFVVLNYEQVRGKIDELLDIEWDFLILDESHRIKKQKSKNHKSSVAIKLH